jgi:hypothetical protein
MASNQNIYEKFAIRVIMPGYERTLFKNLSQSEEDELILTQPFKLYKIITRSLHKLQLTVWADH